MKRYCSHLTHRALALSVLFLTPIGTTATDWPNWRGPNHDGTVAAPGQFSDRGFGLEIVWKKMIGAGYCGMTVAQGRLLTMFADGESDLLAALNAWASVDAGKAIVPTISSAIRNVDEGACVSLDIGTSGMRFIFRAEPDPVAA